LKSNDFSDILVTDLHTVPHTVIFKRGTGGGQKQIRGKMGVAHVGTSKKIGPAKFAADLSERFLMQIERFFMKNNK
jgi:hypothetical protein